MSLLRVHSKTRQAAYDRGDYATALQLLTPLAAQGNAAAQTLSRMDVRKRIRRSEGLRTKQSSGFGSRLPKVMQLLETNLGVMYQNGNGVPQDDDEAVKWYRLAAAQGNASRRSQSRM